MKTLTLTVFEGEEVSCSLYWTCDFFQKIHMKLFQTNTKLVRMNLNVLVNSNTIHTLCLISKDVKKVLLRYFTNFSCFT